VAEPYGVAVMLEYNMAAGRLAKAGQPLKLAMGHQRRQGSANCFQQEMAVFVIRCRTEACGLSC
jgi:hypothetical protein